ncbi:DNA-binding LacI/PurR family transcriptional regulator [Streptomyces sp. SAI-135]|jgi:DNA-binding LacI/PurR family transcriptional regulator|uniref:LacI family DNA-binding transcriptional regulator n=1 Tax=unclassified Streptomyces TaxID=2593676 RepID=UPI002473FE48|nr:MULTISPECIES: LacI family DNA-binding transcriptional regulator [unclassified Streptomyces]MDH6523035.1 DNA-binding LacI/PurR family transcriptional regulator [Streptomyces sp. SAI-090]MDH6554648.1 DNA-binding LacI/PurR family transcriptional regulator [Streptomyces sp. SAI-041]MDH6573918.1 DNA-binding LacI/PurR family transcriptional regulator [Streptomyces sp. SAI-117]MDH6613352.1 DNA-binding LacI/PurR family transcriptional regulator [Streptomyces sp. SAI-135]
MNRQPPTLEDVAREAGVSRATVSRVVNGVRNVDPHIQDLVRSAIERTGYTPNSAARALVTRRTGALALIISGAGDTFAGRVFADPFFGRVVNGVVGYLRTRMIQPVLLFAESEIAGKQVVDYVRQGSADGALVVSIQSDDPLPHMLLAARVPTVLFARPARTTPVSYVDLDHYAGGRLAGERLLARGCRRIAAIGGPADLRAGRQRLAGFRDALARAGHGSPATAEGVFTLDSGAAAMVALLRDQPSVDGVFAANDLMAQGACQVLRELGRRIPEDVAVVGFDDSSVAVTCRPPLTTVRQPVEEMAAAMARMLEEQVQSPRAEFRALLFEPALVVRESG